MGLRERRGRKRSGGDALGIERIDLDRYDFDGFRADVEEIVNLPEAAQRAAKWAIGVPAVITFVVWGVFSGRMPGYVLVPYAAVVFGLCGLGAAVLGVYMVARQRVDQTTAAAGRVVELVGLLHGDFDRVKDDGVPVPIRDVGGVLASEIVFPMLFGAAGNATTLAGPMGFVLRPALKLPMRLVEQRVVGALEQLSPTSEFEPAAGTATDGADSVGELAEATEELVTGLAGEYQRVQLRMEQVVGTVGVFALGPVAGFVAISFLPLTLVLLTGWWLT